MGNLKREIESLLIAAKKKSHKNYVKARIEETKQNSRCRLCDHRDETINHISECSKLTQKEIDTNGWTGWSTVNCARSLNLTIRVNGIHITYNLSKKMRCTNFTGFQGTSESPNLDQTTRPCNSQQKKKKERTCWRVDFAVSVNHQVKLKEIEKKNNYLDLDLARELKKKLWNMKVTVILIVIGAFSTVTKGFVQGQEDLKIKGEMENHPNDSIIKIGQNTDKSPGDLRRLAVSQTQLESIS